MTAHDYEITELFDGPDVEMPRIRSGESFALEVMVDAGPCEDGSSLGFRVTAKLTVRAAIVQGPDCEDARHAIAVSLGTASAEAFRASIDPLREQLARLQRGDA